MDDDAGKAGDEAARDPRGHGIAAGREDERLGDAGNYPAAEHGNKQAYIKVGIDLLRMHKLHHKPGERTVGRTLDQHSGQDRGGGHTCDERGHERPGNAAQQAVLPAADEPAQQHGDVHGAVDRPGVGDGVERLRQNDAQGDAHGGDYGLFDGGHFLHFLFSLLTVGLCYAQILTRSERLRKPPLGIKFQTFLAGRAKSHLTGAHVHYIIFTGVIKRKGAPAHERAAHKHRNRRP